MINRHLLPLLFLLLSIGSALARQAQQHEPVTGDWSGALSIMGTELPIIFHISADPNGTLTATMDSPKQGATGIPVQSVRLVQDSLYIDMKSIGGAYAGKLTNPETIEGQWKQRGQAFVLQLKKGATTEAVKRPQEPAKPYPYQNKEVTVQNKTAGILLAGTLSIPQGSGPHPAVLLLNGSGPQDRDATVMGHKPFLVLADYLTRQGFAVLRLDDRGIGKSSGNFATSTTEDFASDAAAAYAFLKNFEKINHRKVGLLGHSEGALVAAQVAADNPLAAFVVLLAGNSVPGTALLLAQNRALLENAGVSGRQLQQYLSLREAQFNIAATERDLAKAAEQIRKLEQEAKTGLTTQEQQQLGLTPQSAQAVVDQLSSPWMRYYLAYDPAPTLRRLKMPVLMLYGTKDLQVPYQENMAAAERALRGGGNREYTIMELPNLNHLFQTAKTGGPAEYGQLEETFAPAALEAIGTWMKRAVR